MIHATLDWLNTAAFHIGSTPTTWAEIFGFITGLLAVGLVSINRISNFGWGMVNAVFFLILFYNAHLFADGTLQLMFFVLNGLGWYAWLKAGPNKTPLHVEWAGLKFWAITIIGTLVIMAIEIPILQHVNDTYVLADSFILAASVGAQFLMSFKKFENWFIWIAVDTVSIPLYILKGLFLTSGVYVLFMLFCFNGLYQWNKLRERKVIDRVADTYVVPPMAAAVGGD
jgi:nicotinamide mononucleotide transporter